MASNIIVGGCINFLTVVEVQVLRGLEHGPTPEARWGTILQHSVVGLGRNYTNHAFSNPTWRVFDHARPDPLNPRYKRMDPETGYRSDSTLRFMADHGYKIELTPPHDKHAGGIAD